jgi:predicted nucleotidyltransferase
MKPQITIPREKLAEFCRKHHIRKLSLFGSVLRPDFGPGSDVDVLVEFEPDSRAGFFELYNMEQEFGRLIKREKVDLNTPGSLSKYFRDEVIAKAEVLYDAT